jgi:hypothetical protein
MSAILKVAFRMGPYSGEETFPDGATEDEVQELFDVWLSNRSDLGWTVIEGELTEKFDAGPART